MSEPGDTAPERPPVERAEEIVDQAGERLGALASDLGRRLQVLVARAREEAEDIWAEARSLRQHGE